ncbi:MAG TPA: hypothetical protein VHQ20_01945 [Patescibacteria group bacterium]|nr:hypothetical protein [Patescibacteria group bacterium]
MKNKFLSMIMLAVLAFAMAIVPAPVKADDGDPNGCDKCRAAAYDYCMIHTGIMWYCVDLYQQCLARNCPASDDGAHPMDNPPHENLMMVTSAPAFRSPFSAGFSGIGEALTYNLQYSLN